MGDQPNRDGLRQQPNDPARAAPGQQNQQGERHRRPEGEDVAGEGVDVLNNGLEGGVDTGAIQPGRTGQP